MKKQIKYAAVFSGGGFLSSFQLGVVKYLEDNWERLTGQKEMHFDRISAVSGGGTVAMFLAMNNLEMAYHLWLNRVALHGASEIYSSDFIDTHSQSDNLVFKPNLKKIIARLLPDFKINLTLGEKLGAIFSKKKRARITGRILSELQSQLVTAYSNFKSIADNTPLKEKLKLHLDRKAIKNTKFYSGFVSLDTGEYHSVAHDQYASDEDFVNGVLASTSIPLVWDPVKEIKFHKDGKEVISKNNVDGGVRNISPLGDLIKEINEEEDCEYRIFVINCHSKKPKAEDFSNKPIGSILARSIYEIVFNEIFVNDIDHFVQMNHIIAQAKAWDAEIELFNLDRQKIQQFKAVVIDPDPEVDLGNALVANNKLIRKRFDHGVVQASKILGNLTEL